MTSTSAIHPAIMENAEHFALKPLSVNHKSSPYSVVKKEPLDTSAQQYGR